MLRESELNTALMKPRLSYGVSTKALGYVWAPTAVITVITASTAEWYYCGIPIVCGIVGHAVITWAYKKDHRVFEILAKYSLMADQYHPHAREKLPPGLERPAQFGRGLRM